MQFAKSVAVTVSLFACASASSDAPPDPVDAVEDHYFLAAYERAVQRHLSSEAAGIVWFRYSRGRSGAEPEHAVSFSYELKRSTTADALRHEYELHAVLKIAADPIGQQLERIFKERPNLSLEGAIRQVEVAKYDVFETRCPSLRTTFDQLAERSATAIRPVDGSPSFYHGPIYNVEVWGPDSYSSISAEQGNPLFAWASETYKALRACAQQR
jgi:hypothetical protein